jgi:hypothetical protein
VAAINPPGYLHNLGTHTAQTDRLSHGLLLVPDAVGSLRPAGGLRQLSDLVVTAASGMNVNLSAGMCVVPQGQSNLGGGYICSNDGSMTLAIAASNATLARNDLVVARVRDAFYTGTQNALSFEVITGTAASTPTDPALPTDSSFLSLYRVLVPAGATGAAQFTITRLAGPVQPIGNQQFPYGQARQTTPQAGFVGATWGTLVWNIVDFDSHVGFSGSRYVCPPNQGGIYVVEGRLQLGGNAVCNVRVLKNGATIPFSTGNSTADASLQSVTTGLKMVSLVPGDYVEIQGYNTTNPWGTAVFADGASGMTIFRII